MCNEESGAIEESAQMLLQVLAPKGNSRSPFGAFPLGPLFHSKECRYDFWFQTNSTWSLEGKNNKYGKHLIQNNMFIQRPVDFGRNGPPLMWSAASVCMCVFMHVCMCVCAGSRVFGLDV